MSCQVVNHYKTVFFGISGKELIQINKARIVIYKLGEFILSSGSVPPTPVVYKSAQNGRECLEDAKHDEVVLYACAYVASLSMLFSLYQ